MSNEITPHKNTIIITRMRALRFTSWRTDRVPKRTPQFLFRMMMRSNEYYDYQIGINQLYIWRSKDKNQKKKRVMAYYLYDKVKKCNPFSCPNPSNPEDFPF